MLEIRRTVCARAHYSVCSSNTDDRNGAGVTTCRHKKLSLAVCNCETRSMLRLTCYRNSLVFRFEQNSYLFKLKKMCSLKNGLKKHVNMRRYSALKVQWPPSLLLWVGPGCDRIYEMSLNVTRWINAGNEKHLKPHSVYSTNVSCRATLY